MTYFEDGSPYSYLLRPGGRDRSVNVGWLSKNHLYPKGTVSPLVPKALLRLARDHPVNQTRGHHPCSLCAGAPVVTTDVDGQPLLLGSAEIRVQGEHGVWYGAPTLVAHYIAAHHYLPPSDFLEGVGRLMVLGPNEMSAEWQLEPPEPGGAFFMPVEDVIPVNQLVVGQVLRGAVTVGDKVDVVGLGPTRTTTCGRIESFRQGVLQEAREGDNIGVLLGEVPVAGVQRGQVLCAPGSMTAHSHFEADVYVPTGDDGAFNPVPLDERQRPRFYFWARDYDGTMTFADASEPIAPGCTSRVVVELERPVAMEIGTGFTLRERHRSIGRGLLTKIIR